MTLALETVREQVTPYEQIRASVEACLAAPKVEEHLIEMATRAALLFNDVRDTAKHAIDHPKQTVAALVGLAAVAASMRLHSGRPVDMGAGVSTAISTALQQPETTAAIPEALDTTTPLAIEQVRDLAVTRATSIATTHTADIAPYPPEPTEKLPDILPIIPLPSEPEPMPIIKEKAPTLTFSLYKIQQGDTLSDITYEIVFRKQVFPYKTDEAGVTHFSDAFIKAARDIAIENLAVGSMRPPEFTTEGDPIGLTQTYNKNNESMTVEQQVHGFVQRINEVLAATPGNREALEQLFDNEIAPELIPHVLRYLAVDDNIYLPKYNLKDFGVTPKNKQPANTNPKYFDGFGRRLQRNQSF